MFKIQYKFSNQSVDQFIDANEISLRYEFFLGNVIYKNDEKIIIMDWEWIPLLDFAVCLLDVDNNLFEKNLSDEEFEFTESDSKIRYQKTGEYVTISTSFSEEILVIDSREFQASVRKFYKTVIFDILKKNPWVRSNEAFVKYLKATEEM